MNPWFAISFGLLLGQTPEVAPAVPTDADVQDPAAIELRDAWERALLNADATDEGQDSTEGSIQMPVLEVGRSDNALRTVSVPADAAAQQTAGLSTSGTGGAGTAGSSEDTQATQSASSNTGTNSTRNTPQNLAQLRSQLESLQAQQEENAANNQLLQQQLTGMQERAQELERMRQERLSELERSRSWLVAADQALAVGEMAIDDALGEADSALATVLDSATSAGVGQTVVLVEDARSFIAQALEATERRDTYQARGYLIEADWRLREARRQNLDTPGATVVTQ
ncbi:hypothetical protein [Hyalangium versicolor]|uniref:hypothetical protein n=1 Tax=Hyalangium versicolor TaxID=2861190 RepID=UPI001CCCEF28|nr:hypothetical protein [Hyalangium versicolor]